MPNQGIPCLAHLFPSGIPWLALAPALLMLIVGAIDVGPDLPTTALVENSLSAMCQHNK